MEEARRPTKAEFRERLASVSSRSWVVPILIVVALVPMILSNTTELFSAEARRTTGINGLTFVQGEWWRIPAGALLHRDWLHYVFNMVALFLVGRLTERLYGSVVFLWILVLGAVAASFVSVGIQPMSRGIGSSGMVYAAIGALLAFVLLRRREFPTCMWWRIVILLALFIGGSALTFGVYEEVNDNAHAGGFFAGLVVGGFLTRSLLTGTRARRHRLLAVATLALLATSPLIWWRVRTNTAYRAMQHGERAEEAWDVEDYELALTEFSAAIELDPVAPCFFGRGLTKEMLHDHRGALEDLDRAIAEGYTGAFVFVIRGRNRRLIGEYEGAREDFDRAIELDPNQAQAFRERATLRRELGDIEGAEADMARAERLE